MSPPFCYAIDPIWFMLAALMVGFIIGVVFTLYMQLR